jgi:histo-blood group ABO system transferase
MRINLLVVATNKYVRYLESLLDSADAYFLRSEDVQFNVFTDRIDEATSTLATKPYFDRVQFLEIEHRPFPYPTLHRFHFFKRYEAELSLNVDYHFYIDADCIIQKPIAPQDVLSARTAVQHCGFVGERGTYEKRRRSTSYVAPHEGSTYFGGGFWGFSNAEFWKLVDAAVKMIDADAKRRIVPKWHDESVLNRYLITHPPERVLTPAFHWPQNCPQIKAKWKARGQDYECVILLLDKNHAEARSSNSPGIWKLRAVPRLTAAGVPYRRLVTALGRLVGLC